MTLMGILRYNVEMHEDKDSKAAMQIQEIIMLNSLKNVSASKACSLKPNPHYYNANTLRVYYCQVECTVT